MGVELNLAGNAITFRKEDVMLPRNTIGLLADIERAIAIPPREFRMIPTPVAMRGDRNTIGVIEMHAGRLPQSVTPGTRPGEGQYFIPHPEDHHQVVVEVRNELSTPLIIQPGNRVGVMRFFVQGAAGGRVAPEAPLVDPVRFEPEYLPADGSGAAGSEDGITLHADIAQPVAIVPTSSMAIPTGYSVDLTDESQISIRSAGEPVTANAVNAVLHYQPDSDRSKVFCLVHNHSGTDIVIQPGDRVGDMVIAPAQPAALNS